MPYPLISLVTSLPQTLQGQCPVTFSCRTFETFTISFSKDSDASDVFESVKELTVASAPIFVLMRSYPQTHPRCQRLLHSSMRSIILQIRHFLRMMAGHSILLEKNLAGWGLDLGQGPGGLQISIKITRYVSTDYIWARLINIRKPAVSHISRAFGGSDENQ